MKNTLIKARDVLLSISKQWEEKDLSPNFFETPHEIDELISELNTEIELQ